MLGNLIGGSKLKPAITDRTVYVVGDIHGRADLLDEMLDLIDNDRIALGDERPEVVFVGDYIDRGPQSRKVIRTMMSLRKDKRFDVTCLLGNHEQMMLDALADPQDIGPALMWLRNGGDETMESFGFPGMGFEPSSQDIRAALAGMQKSAREELAFVEGLDLMYRNGTLVVVHAGLDPKVPPENQRREVMLWMRPSAKGANRSDGLWVAHGHTICPIPSVENGRINVDTGAVFTDRLTAARVRQGDISFLKTRD